MTTRSILFVATEDWFVRSHFLPLIAAAGAQGWRPMVAARLGAAAEDLRAAGADVHALAGARGRFAPATLAAQAMELSRLLRRLQPDIVHAIALKPAALTALAANAAPRAGLVFAITGLGFLAAARDAPRRAGRGAAVTFLAHAAQRRRACLVFENAHDRRKFLKRGVPLDRCFIAPGAGVELARFHVLPEPASPPIRVGLAARLLRSKGIETALGAAARLHGRGAAVELLIAGTPDPDNPASFTAADVAAWNTRPNVTCLDWVADIRDFWARCHIAIAPSLGGEGLPRSLLEAAACGRALITSDAPGCRDFMASGAAGLQVARGDAGALADAIALLANDAQLRRAFGAGARREIEARYTVQHVTDTMQRAWAAALRAAEARAS